MLVTKSLRLWLIRKLSRKDSFIINTNLYADNVRIDIPKDNQFFEINSTLNEGSMRKLETHIRQYRKVNS